MGFAATSEPAPPAWPSKDQTRLDDAEDLLRAIRDDEVDAFVVGGDSGAGQRVFTLSTADRPYRKFVESMRDGAATLSPSGLILYANPRLAELLLMERDHIVGSSLASLMDDSGDVALEDIVGAGALGAVLEFDLMDSAGRPVPMLVGASPLEVEGDQLTCITFADLSAHKAQEAEIAQLLETQTERLTSLQEAQSALIHQAHHDPLTGLPNRLLIVDRLDRALDPSAAVEQMDPVPTVGSSPRAATPRLMLIILDVGSLDNVNDTFGHQIGEQVIVRCTENLMAEMHPGDDLGRLSDNSLAVRCPHASDAPSAQMYADALRRGLARPFNLGGIDIRLPVSAAVALAAPDVADGDELLRRAGTALQWARRDGSARVYDETMRDELLRRAEMETLVNQVIADGIVTLGYQPVVRLDDRRTIGAEALLRLRDRDGNPVSALDVVEAADRGGLISALGELILRTACQDAAHWSRAAPERSIPVSVNVSARQLDDATLPDRVTAALHSAALDPSNLWLEVTESALMSDPARSAILLAELKARGIKLSADDFGTGYSSLAYLKAFPLDVLKVDQSFVAGLPQNLEDAAITRAIVAMAAALGLSVVAEGIETDAQLDALLELGAGAGQGYLWSKALPLEEFEAWLETEAEQPEPSQPRAQAAAESGNVASAEERIDSVLEILAHEIRGPLTVVVGYADMLHDDDPAVDPREAADSIAQAARRIDRLLTTMVEVSTSDDDAVVVALSETDPIAMVERIVGELRGSTANVLRLVARPDAPTVVKVDEAQIQQILTNLVTNAANVSATDATIDISVTVLGPMVEISVADRGGGIDRDQLGLIFRKYGRADRSSPGTGLGLYVARRLARGHGGDVRYRPRAPGPGSVFTVSLPRFDQARRPDGS